MTATPLMHSPGHIDPLPLPREITPREDGRVDLIGLPKKRIAELFAEAGLDAKAAKLRAKQVFHWLYHRGVTRFDDMTGANWTTFGSMGTGANQFQRPIGLDIGTSGQIFVADSDNSRIVRFDDMTGTNWTAFGTRGNGVNQLDHPYDVDAP